MESDLHRELKNRGVDYLWNKGYRLNLKEKTAGYYGIYDVWGMARRTYYTMGLEIKVSRSDFHASHRYKERRLSYSTTTDAVAWGGANENYYICPSGLIQPEETGCYGLLWWSGKRLLNKKKPSFIKIHLKDKLDQLLDLLEPKPF